jgi:hypothetical protein
MKRLISVLSFAVLSTAAVADTSLPYDQLTIDRALPNIPAARDVGVDYPFSGSAPYDPLAVDMALPNLDIEEVRPAPTRLASSGMTRFEWDLGYNTMDASPWATDHHFIAPPQ